MQLRIAWGGGGEKIWHGSIALSAGRFSELIPLGVDADEPGSIWLAGRAIEIRQRSLRAYDGVDVMVTADLDANLTISLDDEQGQASKPIEIPLRKLIKESHNSTLDSGGNRILVSRSPGDRLRVRYDRQHLVFAPGEMFAFKVEPHLIDSVPPQLRLQVQITSNPGGQEFWSKEYDTGPEGTDTAITLKLPEEEGVYDLVISTAQPSARLRPRLKLKKQTPEVERRVQFVVLSPQPPAENAGPLTKIVEINVNSRWWERLGNVPLIPGFRKGPLGNGDSAAWEHPKLGPMIQLGPGGAGPATSWEAYPLPITNPGQAHVLEIEYPNNVPQSMGISLIEPNAAGAVSPIGLDSGVYVSDEEAETPPQMARHRVVFWPRTRTPLALITNRRPGSRAVYGKITVLGVSHQQLSALLGRGDSVSAVPPAFADNQPGERLFAGYMDRPLFVENFSAPEALDAPSHRSLDDWSTFYQGGLRLSKYLKHAGYSGLMMSVYADGSSIYPSQVLEPTPRYDTGAFFATGQDPQRKDGLELLLRLFDREKLTLIPALHFASPLPELEALKREGGLEAAGLEWIGADGTAWLTNHAPRQGLAPYYNLLDARVQAAMLRVVREISARYAQHPSFGGLSLQLSAEGYAQLPGEDWGYDDMTIARFERDTKTRVPGIGPQRFEARAKFLSGPGRAAWLQWRAGVVADFHHRVEQVISSQRKGAKLYLAGGTMLDSRHTQYRLRPTLPRRTRFDDALIELGLRAQSYRDDPRIVLLRPQLLRPAATSLPVQAAELELNWAPEVDRLFSTAQPGSLFFHEPQKSRLASFDAKSPFGADKTYTWLVSQMSPSGERNRRRFAHSLATLDSQVMFDGGWLLPLGQQDALKDLMSTYRQLPGERFDTLSGEFQPITIRTLARNNETYVYLVNDSPWEAGVTLHLDLPADCKLEKLGESRGVGPLERAAAGASCKIKLRPYDLVGARFASGSVRFQTPEVTLPAQVQQNLQRRIQDLGARVAALGHPQPLPLCENPGFELSADGESLPAWSTETPGAAMIDTTQKRAGTQSLKMVSTGQPVSIRSQPFVAPITGRLAVEVWLRAPERGPQTSARIAIQWELRDGKSEERVGIINNVGATASTPGDWVRYSFPVDDLPSEGVTNAHVRFDLTSAGEMWLDEVQLFDLSFSETERFELSKLISLANVKLEAGQLADCARLLEGYWPQFLVANVPLSQTPAPLVQRPGTTPPPAKKPGMLDNLRGYLPKISR